MCKSREQWWFGGGDDENTSDDSNTSSSFDSNTNTSSSSNTGGYDTGMVGFTGGTSGDLNPVGDYQQIVDNVINYGEGGPSTEENSVFDNTPSDFSKEPNMYYIGDDMDVTTNDTLIQAYSHPSNPGNMSAFTTNKHLLPTHCLVACNQIPECGAVVARQMNDEKGNGFTKCWFKNNLTTSAQQASPSDQVGTFIKKNPGSVRLV